MNRDMICVWLGLADKHWPPDPYALLGLSAEQCDAPLIEKRVHEQMCRLRGYQLLHPEEATEGMTRVAQAYIALIERHGSCQAAPAACAVAFPKATPQAATSNRGLSRRNPLWYKFSTFCPPVERIPGR